MQSFEGVVVGWSNNSLTLTIYAGYCLKQPRKDNDLDSNSIAELSVEGCSLPHP